MTPSNADLVAALTAWRTATIHNDKKAMIVAGQLMADVIAGVEPPIMTAHTIRVPEELWQAAMALARGRRQTVSELIRAWLAEYVDNA